MKKNAKFVVCIAVSAFMVSLGLTDCAADVESADSRPDVVFTEPDNLEVNSAMEHARKTFPEFWKAQAKDDPDYSDFNVKIGLPTPAGDTEHIWVSNVSQKLGRYTGTLINVPYNLAEIEYGDEVTFKIEQISDWQYVKNGKSEGNFTTRVLLKDMSTEKANQIRAMLGWDK